MARFYRPGAVWRPTAVAKKTKLPTPPPEHHFHALDLGEGRDGTGAFYLPFAWRDGEEQAPEPVLDDGEPLVGVGGRMLLGYLRPDGDWAAEGWSGVVQLYLRFNAG